MAAITKQIHPQYGNWQINLDHYCLQDESGNEIFVQPRLLKLLSILSENLNRVVSRKELINLVWDDVVVGEESLSKAAFDLRKFLDENFKDPPRIITIRKVGYKLQLYQNKVKNGFKYMAIKVLKITAYTVVIGILMVLVLRGLRY